MDVIIGLLIVGIAVYVWIAIPSNTILDRIGSIHFTREEIRSWTPEQRKEMHALLIRLRDSMDRLREKWR